MAGTLSATVVKAIVALPVTASFAGTGGLDSSVNPVIPISAAFTGLGSLTANAFRTAAIAAPLSSDGALTAAASQKYAQAPAFASTGALTATATKVVPPDPIISNITTSPFRIGDTITITGSNFFSGDTVTIGGVYATSVSIVNSTTITCVIPAGLSTGANNVFVIGQVHTSNAYAITLAALPTITNVTTSPFSVGNTITLTGTGFVGTVTVTVGGVSATSVSVTNSNSLTCVIPSVATGSRDVVVTASSRVSSPYAITVVPVAVPVTVAAMRNAAAGSSTSAACDFATAGYVPQTGDFVVMWIAVSDQTASIGTPAGWTHARPALTGAAHRFCCVYRAVTAGEVSGGTTLYTCTNLFSTAETRGILGVIIRGADPAAPIDNANATVGNTPTTTHVLLGLSSTATPNYSNSLVLAGVCSDGLGAYTTPAGYTLIATDATSLLRGLYSNNTLTTAGVAVASTNITTSVSETYASITVAFKRKP